MGRYYSNSKTRFYFNGNELIYIKTIPQEGEEELLDVIKEIMKGKKAFIEYVNMLNTLINSALHSSNENKD